MRLSPLVAVAMLSLDVAAHAYTVTEKISEYVLGPQNLLINLNYTLTFDPKQSSRSLNYGYTSAGLTYDGGNFAGAAVALEPAFDQPVQYLYQYRLNYPNQDSLEIESSQITGGFGYYFFIYNSQSKPTAGTFSFFGPTRRIGYSPADLEVATVTNLNENPGPVSLSPEPSSLLLLGTGLLGFSGVMVRRKIWQRV